MALEDDGSNGLCKNEEDEEEEEEEEEVDEEEEDDEEVLESSLERPRHSHMGDVTGSSLERPLLGVLLPPHIADDGLILDNMVDNGEMEESGMKVELGSSSSYGNVGIEEEVEEEWEPREGMEFDSEEAARLFYNSYARRVGFSIRVSIYSRSKRNGAIISRRFVCSKEGFRRKRNAASEGSKATSKRPRAITREGCKAMILVKRQSSSGKWVVSRFEQAHSHPLAPPGKVHCLRSHRGDKDKTIRELTQELERVSRQCAGYRAHLLSVLKDIEEQLSKKVDDIRQSIRQLESEDPE